MRVVVKTVAELGRDLPLAPERHVILHEETGIRLGELVSERSVRMEASELDGAIVLDTTDARDGVLDLAAASRHRGVKSAKKMAEVGDLLVSRLRPYLRQIAFVHPDASRRRALAVSTEFYVLAPQNDDEDVAWLLPFLLSSRVQATLAAAQEGGHHPRVPRVSLLELRVPEEMVARRSALGRAVRAALSRVYRAQAAYRALLG